MRRPGYREAVVWLAANDDCYWLAEPRYPGDGNPMLSVSAALVRDLFEVSDDRLIADIRRALRRVHPNHEALHKTP